MVVVVVVVDDYEQKSVSIWIRRKGAIEKAQPICNY
jgi:hypothetical protein